MSIVKLTPAFKDYLWGGTKLKENYGKKTDMDPVAESWELSVHPDGPSIVASGELVLAFRFVRFNKIQIQHIVFMILVVLEKMVNLVNYIFKRRLMFQI